jgi:hypothetical protein
MFQIIILLKDRTQKRKTYSEWAASVEGVLRMNKCTFSEHATSEVGVFREQMIPVKN